MNIGRHSCPKFNFVTKLPKESLYYLHSSCNKLGNGRLKNARQSTFYSPYKGWRNMFLLVNVERFVITTNGIRGTKGECDGASKGSFIQCKGISQHSNAIEAPCKRANMHGNAIEAPMW